MSELLDKESGMDNETLQIAALILGPVLAAESGGKEIPASDIARRRLELAEAIHAAPEIQPEVSATVYLPDNKRQ